jgi:predicted DNA-binding transcriptional regulator AlpA
MASTAQSCRAKQGAELLGIGDATFWRWTKRADFPKPRWLSPRCTVWDRTELLTWRDAQGAKAAA